MNEIILVGGGGHCKSVIDVIELEGKFKIAGIIDNNIEVGTKILKYNIIGKDANLKGLRKKYDYAIVTVGQIKSPNVRIKLYRILKDLNFNLPVIISPLAYVSKYSLIDEGTVIMHNVIINAGVKIGKNCIINTNALIEHDVMIEDNCHISTGVKINGQCIIKEGVFIGSNATVENNICIGSKVIIGAGSIVNKNILDFGTYIGNPVRRLK